MFMAIYLVHLFNEDLFPTAFFNLEDAEKYIASLTEKHKDVPFIIESRIWNTYEDFVGYKNKIIEFSEQMRCYPAKNNASEE